MKTMRLPLSAVEGVLIGESANSAPKETAYLFFHEGNQRFTIIPNGVTITEAYDGKGILASSVEELRGIVKGLEFAASQFGLEYTQDMFEEMPIGEIYVAEKND